MGLSESKVIADTISKACSEAADAEKIDVDALLSKKEVCCHSSSTRKLRPSSLWSRCARFGHTFLRKLEKESVDTQRRETEIAPNQN